MRKCPPKPPLRQRPLLDSAQAVALEELFKALANDTRLRMLHALVRHKEIRVGDLAEQLEMSPQAVSNQLQRLRGIVAARRDGNNIYYRITDPCVPILLDRGLCLLEEADKRRLARRLV